jgi:hypothetical protein
MPKKYGWNLGVATNMDKSISLIAGIKKWRGMGLMLYAKGSNLDYDAGFEKSDNVWKNLAS